MNEKRTPQNEAGQPPTRTPKETEERLREKESEQMGQANRERTEEQIEDVAAEEAGPFDLSQVNRQGSNRKDLPPNR